MGSEYKVLRWHELDADEAYHIAHLENESRDLAATYLGKVAFSSDPLSDGSSEKAFSIITHSEERSFSWLNDLAVARGLEPEPPKDVALWVQYQFKQLQTEGITSQEIARNHGINSGLLSQYKNVKRVPGQRALPKLVEAFASERGFEGEDKDLFMFMSPIEKHT